MTGNRKTICCEIEFESYIAHPYWPERERVIGIELKSGVNRLKIDEKKEAALKAQCEKEGITLADYKTFVVKAARQWYRVDNDDLESAIIVPRHQLAGCLVETIGRTPKAVHGKYNADSFRHHVRLSDFQSDRTAADGVFDRYVKLEGSNKRDHQRNEFIGEYEGVGSPFVAIGTLSVPTDTKVEELKRLIEYGVCEVGVGASRKMGFGRGRILEFEGE